MDDLEADASDERTRWLMRYQPWLELLARLEVDSRFQSKFSASDAVQQTLVEAWQHWSRFRGSSEAQRLAWLRQILAHQLAHLARHYAGTQKRDIARERIEATLAESSDRLHSIAVSMEASPSQQLVQKERELLLARILERLPADYREVLILRNLQELSHAEVAQRMGRSEGAVRMLWVRALAELRRELEQTGFASPSNG